MRDATSYNKATFWALLIAFLCVAMVPSIVLIQTAQQYMRFLSLWDPGAIQSMRMKRFPRHDLPLQEGDAPQVYFAEFRLRAPSAKEVFIAGDFNRWKAGAIALQRGRGSRGDWEVLVPLPPGKYQYLFKVDGTWMTDPKSRSFGQWQGLQTSIKQVP